MKRGALYFWVVVAAVVVTIVVSHFLRAARTERQLVKNDQPIAVTTMPLQAPSAIDTIAVTGSLRGIHEAEISAETNGRVIAVYREVGDFLEAGQPIMQLDSTLKSLTARQAEIAYEKATADLKRAENLYNAQSISDADLEGARLAAKAAEVNWRMAQKDYLNTRVCAPFAGTLVARFVDLGEMVAPGAHVASLVDLRKLKAKFDLTERELVKMQEGDSVLALVDALPGLLLQGTITERSLQASSGTRSFAVEATFPGRPGIASGMFLRGVILVAGTGEGFLVPREAVYGSGDDMRIYLAKNGKAQAHPVQSEIPRGAWVVIHAGDLQPGQPLIVTASKAIEDGAPVSDHGENQP
jgi:membrane fusion protein (multidrug efflux system)